MVRDDHSKWVGFGTFSGTICWLANTTDPVKVKAYADRVPSRLPFLEWRKTTHHGRHQRVGLDHRRRVRLDPDRADGLIAGQVHRVTTPNAVTGGLCTDCAA